MISEVVTNAAIGGVLGLLIGSFLNVVIHRLPRMMEQERMPKARSGSRSKRKKVPRSSCHLQQTPSR